MLLDERFVLLSQIKCRLPVVYATVFGIDGLWLIRLCIILLLVRITAARDKKAKNKNYKTNMLHQMANFKGFV